MADMNDFDGYVRIHRKILTHDLWHEDQECFALFTVLLLRAFYYGPDRGTLTTSLADLAHQMPRCYETNRQRVRTLLLQLERRDMIVTFPTKTGTRIRVVNYDDYQADAHKIEATMRRKAEKKAAHTQSPHLSNCLAGCGAEHSKPTPALGEVCAETCGGNSSSENQNQINSHQSPQFSCAAHTDPHTSDDPETDFACGSKEEYELLEQQRSPHP